jgi:hypothetical protein
VTGTVALPNQRGISIDNQAQRNRVGTNADGLSDDLERNVFSGNSIWGVIVFAPGTTDNVIAGNFIGTDATGLGPLGNGLDGVLLTSGATFNRVGTNGDGHGDPAEGNLIAFNAGDGVRVSTSSTLGDAVANSIRGNSIHSNAELGIDLNATSLDDEVTPNDPGDTDTGGNELQNFPVLHNAVAVGPVGTAVAGQLRSMPGMTYLIDFYASTAADPSGFGEGERYLGSLVVTTNPAGVANFAGILPAKTMPGEVLTATATDPAGSTSEFSAAVVVKGPPISAPADLAVLFVAAGDADADVRRADADLALLAVVSADPHVPIAAGEPDTDEGDGATPVELPVASEPRMEPGVSDPVFADLGDLGAVLELS